MNDEPKKEEFFIIGKKEKKLIKFCVGITSLFFISLITAFLVSYFVANSKENEIRSREERLIALALCFKDKACAVDLRKEINKSARGGP